MKNTIGTEIRIHFKEGLGIEESISYHVGKDAVGWDIDGEFLTITFPDGRVDFFYLKSCKYFTIFNCLTGEKKVKARGKVRVGAFD